jgi:hypothetical protein
MNFTFTTAANGNRLKPQVKLNDSRKTEIPPEHSRTNLEK